MKENCSEIGSVNDKFLVIDAPIRRRALVEAEARYDHDQESDALIIDMDFIQGQPQVVGILPLAV